MRTRIVRIGSSQGVRLPRPLLETAGSPSSATVDDALTRYYETHGLPPDGGAHEAWFHVQLGPLHIPLPNPPARRRAVFYHDVHHLVTGYDTVFSVGEIRIAAFEVGASCGRVWVAWLLNLGLMAVGIFVRPRDAFRAFRRGRGSGSLYLRRETPDELRRMRVGDVAVMLGVNHVVMPATPRLLLDFVVLSLVPWLLVVGAIGLVALTLA